MCFWGIFHVSQCDRANVFIGSGINADCQQFATAVLEIKMITKNQVLDVGYKRHCVTAFSRYLSWQTFLLCLFTLWLLFWNQQKPRLSPQTFWHLAVDITVMNLLANILPVSNMLRLFTLPFATLIKKKHELLNKYCRSQIWKSETSFCQTSRGGNNGLAILFPTTT